MQRALAPTRQLQRTGDSRATLSFGAQGAAVTALQQRLNQAGASVISDGIFGAATKAAVVAFQQSAGLPADGIVGPQTWQRLPSGPAADNAHPHAPTDPLQTVIAAKIGLVRAALKGAALQSEGSSNPGPDAASAGQVGAILGRAVPGCGIPVPTSGSIPTVDDLASRTGLAPSGLPIQRSWLDDAAAWAGDSANSVADWAGETVNEAAQSASGAASWVDEQVSAASSWVGDQASAAAEAAGQAVGTATDVIGGMADDVATFTEEIVSTAKETVAGGIDIVIQSASDVAHDVSEFSDDLKKRYAHEISILNEVIQHLNAPFGDLSGVISQLDDILKGLAGGGASAGLFGLFEDEPEPKPIQLYALLDIEGSITRGGVNVPGTGYSEPRYSVEPITWWRAMDDVITVQAKVNVDCHWDIASEGRGTSISSANDPAVTEVSYLTIIHDLREMSESYLKSYPVQTTFWSEPLIERHELFHCQDYISQATRFLPTAQSWLETQSLKAGKGGDADIERQVQALIGGMRKQIEDDGMAYFKNGGEARAYSDGKGAYDALIAQIQARAKAEKWK